MKKIIKNICLGIGGTYLISCLVTYSLQKKFLYSPSFDVDYNKRWNKIILDNKLLALYFEPQNYKKTIVIFHGNNQNAGFRNYFLRIFPKDFRIIVAEYPGFGENKSIKINKKNIIQHCENLINNISNLNIENTIILGESFGTGVASEISTKFNFPKLILITPYSSMLDVVKSKLWFMPIKVILKDNFDSIKNLNNYNGEVLTIISEKDKVIPSRVSNKLINNLKCTVTKIVVIDANHTNWWSKMNNLQKNVFKNFFK